MKPRNTIIAFLLLVILLGVWVILDQPFKEEKVPEQKTELLFPGFDKATIKKIELVNKGETATLARGENDEWIIRDGEASFPVDPKAIDTLFTKTTDMKKAEIISTNPEKRSVYQVDSQGIEVKMYQDGDTPAYHYFIGKNGPDFFSTFVRLEGKDEVVVVAEYLKTVFDKTVKMWKNRTLVAVEKDRITSITVEKGDGSGYSIKKDGSDWKMSSPEEMLVEPKEADRLVNTFSNFVASDYAETLEPPDYGFEKPALKLTVGLDDGTSKIILFGKEKENVGYYAKESESKWVFTVPKYRYTTFDKKPEDLKAKPTPTPAPTPPTTEEGTEQAPAPVTP